MEQAYQIKLQLVYNKDVEIYGIRKILVNFYQLFLLNCGGENFNSNWPMIP